MNYNFNLRIPEYRPVNLKDPKDRALTKGRTIQVFEGLPNEGGQSEPVGGVSPHLMLNTCMRISNNGVYLGALNSHQHTHKFGAYGMSCFFSPEETAAKARSIFNRKKYVVDAQGCPWETRATSSLKKFEFFDDAFFAEKSSRFDLSIMRKLKLPIVVGITLSDLSRTMVVENGKIEGFGTITLDAHLLIHKSIHQAGLCMIRSEAMYASPRLYPVITFYNNPFDLACYKFVEINLRALFFELPIYIHVYDADRYINPTKIAKYSSEPHLARLYAIYTPILQLVDAHNSLLLKEQ